MSAVYFPVFRTCYKLLNCRFFTPIYPLQQNFFTLKTTLNSRNFYHLQQNFFFIENYIQLQKFLPFKAEVSTIYNRTFYLKIFKMPVNTRLVLVNKHHKETNKMLSIILNKQHHKQHQHQLKFLSLDKNY